MCSIVAHSACAVLSTGSDVMRKRLAANIGGQPRPAVVRRSPQSRCSSAGSPLRREDAMSDISRERSRPMRPFAANHLCDRCGRVHAKIRAHNDMRCGVRPRGRRVWTRGASSVYSISSWADRHTQSELSADRHSRCVSLVFRRPTASFARTRSCRCRHRRPRWSRPSCRRRPSAHSSRRRRCGHVGDWFLASIWSR
jgi:hypothetical protein